MASPLILTGPYMFPQLLVFSTSFEWPFHPGGTSATATVAGLGWPSTSNRGTPSTHPDASTIEAPAHTTSTPSASLEAMTTPNDPGTTTPMDTYAAPPNLLYLSRHRIAQLSMLFVTRVSPHEWFTRFTSRSLLIQTTPGSYSLKRYRPREFPNVVIPNTTSTVLSGNWEWSLRTADYWRHHFEIPLLHGHNPFHNVPIETTSSPDEPGLATRIQDLAKQLSDTLTAATASGELNETWRMVEHMSFHDAIQILQQASNFPSEWSDRRYVH